MIVRKVLDAAAEGIRAPLRPTYIRYPAITILVVAAGMWISKIFGY